MSINLTPNILNSLSPNFSSIQLSSSGLTTTINNETKSNLVPNISIVFETERALEIRSNQELMDLADHFFREHYFCGNGVEFNSTDTDRRIIRVRNDNEGRNRYRNGIIYLRYTWLNPIVFLHEIIHAIINDNGAAYHIHNDNDIGPCRLLDLYTNRAPGFMLDMVNRLEMHYPPETLVSSNHRVMYLPLTDAASTLYPNLYRFCSNNPEVEDLVPKSLLCTVTEFFSFKSNNKKNETSRIGISDEKFLSLKFGDEYDTIHRITPFDSNIDKKTYVDNNLKQYKEFNTGDKK